MTVKLGMVMLKMSDVEMGKWKIKWKNMDYMDDTVDRVNKKKKKKTDR